MSRLTEATNELDSGNTVTSDRLINVVNSTVDGQTHIVMLRVHVPGEEDSVVMVKAEVMTDGVGQLILVVVQRTLPSTETCQRPVRVIIDLQFRLVYIHRHRHSALAQCIPPWMHPNTRITLVNGHCYKISYCIVIIAI